MFLIPRGDSRVQAAIFCWLGNDRPVLSAASANTNSTNFSALLKWMDVSFTALRYSFAMSAPHFRVEARNQISEIDQAPRYRSGSEPYGSRIAALLDAGPPTAAADRNEIKDLGKTKEPELLRRGE